MRIQLATLLGTAVLGFAADGRGDEWPQFRGTNGSGVVSGSPLPAEWGPDKNVRWKTKIPGVAWSCPVVWGDRIFVTTAITEKQRKPTSGFGGGGGAGGGPGGGRPGGGFTPPPPGQLIPGFVQGMLNLTEAQKTQLEQLQKDVDSRRDQILTEEQRKQFREPAQGAGRPGGLRMPQPGKVLSTALLESLKLTDEQKAKVAELQKEVDERLAKLLTEEQSTQLKQMAQGPGRGGPGGGYGNPKPPDVVYRWEVYCLDRESGKVLWKQLAREDKPKIATHSSNTYATETPVTDGERLYAYFGMHGVFCYDLEGKLLWKKDLGSYPMQAGWGTASSPVIEGDRLFLQIDNEQKSFLVALDKKSGEEVWRVDRPEKTTWGTPLVWKNKVRTELVTPGSQKVRSYDPASGKLLWELTVGGGQCSSTPVGDDERLYVGLGASPGGGPGGRGPGGGGPPGGGGGPPGGRPGGQAQRQGGGGGLFAVKAGASGDISLKAGETSGPGVAWQVPRGGPEMASPLLYLGHIYVFGRGGVVSCYDAQTGKQHYRERIPGAKMFWASPWASDGKVFALDDSGTTFVLQAGQEFKVLGKNTLDEMTWATPAAAGGALFLRGVDHLYCIKP